MGHKWTIDVGPTATAKSRLAALAEHYSDIPQPVLNAAGLLIDAFRSVVRPPNQMDRGYFPTVCVAWRLANGKHVEIEIGSMDYEYHGPDGSIRYFDHASGTRVTQELLSLLPSVETPTP